MPGQTFCINLSSRFPLSSFKTVKLFILYLKIFSEQIIYFFKHKVNKRGVIN